jgi:putative transposase
MIDPNHKLSICRQAELLEVSRASVYYVPRPLPERDLALMRRIDELHLELPFAGARMLRDLLQEAGFAVGRKHVRTLMNRMGVEALYRKPRTTRRDANVAVFPYLLRNRAIERPNQAWAMDITYIPMRRGFVYLAAVMDWRSRRLLAWRLSNTLTADFCVAALEDAIREYGAPEIVNTDQGSQFTSAEFVTTVQRHGIRLSMDGKGCWRDNVFLERFWRTLKYEEVYLHAYETVSEARAGITRYVGFYNSRRPHDSLTRRTPDAVYFNLPLKAAA